MKKFIYYLLLIIFVGILGYSGFRLFGIFSGY